MLRDGNIKYPTEQIKSNGFNSLRQIYKKNDRTLEDSQISLYFYLKEKIGNHYTIQSKESSIFHHWRVRLDTEQMC